jgi:hypothetical protein
MEILLRDGGIQLLLGPPFLNLFTCLVIIAIFSFGANKVDGKTGMSGVELCLWSKNLGAQRNRKLCLVSIV